MVEKATTADSDSAMRFVKKPREFGHLMFSLLEIVNQDRAGTLTTRIIVPIR